MLQTPTTLGVPAHCASATLLFTRIDTIIGLIPIDFPHKFEVERSLRAQQDSIRFTAPTIMPCRWEEVAEILTTWFPLSENNPEPWVREIAYLFCEEPEEVRHDYS
jgi:hypothetical protein